MVWPPAAAIRDLLVLGGLGDLEKFFGPVLGLKRGKTAKKWIFPVWGAVLGLMPPDQSFLHAKCGPSEPCLGSHVSLGPGIWPFQGALGAISSVGDQFCLFGIQPAKKLFFGGNSAPPGSFRECFGSSEARLRCATFLL